MSSMFKRQVDSPPPEVWALRELPHYGSLQSGQHLGPALIECRITAVLAALWTRRTRGIFLAWRDELAVNAGRRQADYAWLRDNSTLLKG